MFYKPNCVSSRNELQPYESTVMETSFSAADAASALAEIARALEKCPDLDQAVKLRNQAAELLFHIKTAAFTATTIPPRRSTDRR